MPAKNSPVGSREALRERFGDVFDVDIVLSYDFAEFFDFCQFLCLFGYDMGGFDGKLQSPEELVRRQVGNCWDQTELQREWFERHRIEVKTYLLYYYLNDARCPSHSILTYRDGDKWVWFEPMFVGTAVEYSGVREYANEQELLVDFRRVFALNGQKSGTLPQELRDENWTLCQYTRPRYGISDTEFYDWCRSGEVFPTPTIDTN